MYRPRGRKGLGPRVDVPLDKGRWEEEETRRHQVPRVCRGVSSVRFHVVGTTILRRAVGETA